MEPLLSIGIIRIQIENQCRITQNKREMSKTKTERKSICLKALSDLTLWSEEPRKGDPLRSPPQKITEQINETKVNRQEHEGVARSDIVEPTEVTAAACFMQVSSLAYSSTAKMEAKCSSETSVHFHRTTSHYISEDRNYHLENPKSYWIMTSH